MLKIHGPSFDTTIEVMRAYRKDERKAAKRAVAAAGKVFLANVRQFGAHRDGHTLQWMAAVDHPYARRHGSIQESVLGHPGWWVHYQSGRLKSALKSRTTHQGLGYAVFADTAQVPYARYVIQGTRVMLGRDFIWITANDPKVQREMMRAQVRVLGKELRTKASVRFF